MLWQCRMIDDDQVPEKERRPGDMWLAEWMIEGNMLAYFRENFLSERYFRDHYGKRPPLFVQLPNGRSFCVDRSPTSGGDGWTAVGEAPNITLTPSIDDCRGKPYGYHGHLQDGVLTDDVDGRTF